MCGVFGVFGHPEAANITYLGLHALQHRGQESAGIASSDGARLALQRGMGRVTDIFASDRLVKLAGEAAIGHVRYSTAGGSHLKNAQPLAVEYTQGSLAISHNGNLTNAHAQRSRLEREGSIFHSGSDSEVILHLIARSQQLTLEDRIADALEQIEGAYSLLFLSERQMIAVRDPLAIRPLCLGKLPGDTPAWVFASEAASFKLIGAEYVRDIEPGEMVTVERGALRSNRPLAPKKPRHCILEYIYFARPDSVLDQISVYEARKELGRELARQDSIEADVVIPVPDSAVQAALGYSQESGIPFEMGLVRSPYVGRTFIEPEQSIRHFGVKLKHSTVAEVLRGKRVVVVDDSVVRGTTSRKIVKMVRAAGATEVHLRISSPQVAWPCYYGIDTPTRSELIAPSHTSDEIRQYLTCDTLAYLPLGATAKAVVAGRAPLRRSSTHADPAVEAEVVNGRHPPATRALGPGAHSGEAGEGRARLSLPLVYQAGTETQGESVAKPGGPGEPSEPSEPGVDGARQVGRFCDACFSGRYPVAFEGAPSLRQMRLLDL